MIKISIIIYTNFFYKEKTMAPKISLLREPQIINQTENLKILVGLYTSLDNYTEEN